jgi:hypothetical protein
MMCGHFLNKEGLRASGPACFSIIQYKFVLTSHSGTHNNNLPVVEFPAGSIKLEISEIEGGYYE